MAESRMGELASQLLGSARARRLDWHEGVTKGSYVVDFPDISLSIRDLMGGTFALTLINDEGYEIESIQGISSDLFGDTLGTVLEEIYNIARRQTFDIEGNIDKALEYLRRE
jgi:hypothetical protein